MVQQWCYSKGEEGQQISGENSSSSPHCLQTPVKSLDIGKTAANLRRKIMANIDIWKPRKLLPRHSGWIPLRRSAKGYECGTTNNGFSDHHWAQQAERWDLSRVADPRSEGPYHEGTPKGNISSQLLAKNLALHENKMLVANQPDIIMVDKQDKKGWLGMLQSQVIATSGRRNTQEIPRDEEGLKKM